jgi:hypothetical protein
MKRKMTNSIALGLTVLLAVMTFVPTTQGQQQKKKPVAATGVVTHAVGQVLRLTVNAGAGSDTITVRFAWKRFVGGTCSAVMGATVCHHTVASEGMSAPVTLGSNEAASLDVGGDGNGVEVMVFSNDTNVRVNAMIIDAATGNVVAGEVISQPGLVDNGS